MKNDTHVLMFKCWSDNAFDTVDPNGENVVDDAGVAIRQEQLRTAHPD